MVAKYLFAWLLLAVVAVANGVIRQATYGKSLPELAAHQLSTVTGIVAIGLVVRWLSRLWPLSSAKQALIIGLCWLVMTIAFEFGFGRFVAGHSCERLLADYNLAQGRVWSLFLLWITLAPWAFFKMVQQAE